MNTILDEMIAQMEASMPEETQLSEADLKGLASLGLTSCDFVGDSGCTDPDCWRCHSILRPENLRTLAKNLAFAAMLCRAWQQRGEQPAWCPGCCLSVEG